MRWSFLGLSDDVDADAGPPKDADIAAATVRARSFCTLHAPALLALQPQSRGFCGASARRLEGPSTPAAERLLGC
jgi:hypothetical protein